VQHSRRLVRTLREWALLSAHAHANVPGSTSWLCTVKRSSENKPCGHPLVASSLRSPPPTPRHAVGVRVRRHCASDLPSHFFCSVSCGQHPDDLVVELPFLALQVVSGAWQSLRGKEGPVLAGPAALTHSACHYLVPGIGRWAGVSLRRCSAAFSAS
jgi:hypothetical protein